MHFETWLNELTGHASRRAIAAKIDKAQSTLTRQLDRGALLPEMVISLCRAYGRSPVTGLVETGYVNAYEVEGPGVAAALEQATNEQLLDEIMRRSDPQARYLFGGDDDVIGLAPDALPLHAVADSSPDEGEGLPDDYEP